MKSQRLRQEKLKQQQQKIDCFFRNLNKNIKLLTEFYKLMNPNANSASNEDIQELFSRIYGTKAFIGEELNFQQYYQAFNIWNEIFEPDLNPHQKLMNRLNIEVKYKERYHRKCK